MPQSGWTSGESRCLARQTGCSGGERPELVLLLGEDLLHQLLEALVELRTAAAGVGEDEAPLLDELAEVLPGRGGELGRVVAVEEERSGPGAGPATVAVVGSTTCQVSRCLPVAGDDADEVADVVGVVVPVAAGAVAELVDQDRRAALGQEQQREARRHQLVLLVGPAPEARELVLVVDQLLGAQAIPVVLAEEPDAGEPPGPLQSVEIVDTSSCWPCPKFWPHLEVAGEPVDAALEVGR